MAFRKNPITAILVTYLMGSTQVIFAGGSITKETEKKEDFDMVMFVDVDMSMGIVDFWFSPEVQPFWFVKDKDFDETLRQRFEGMYNEAVSRFQDGKFDELKSGKAALAFVLILDQLSRNMFRDTPKAFATDDLALNISKMAIQKGFEQELPSLAHYNFLCMPFMHSENLGDQEEGIRLFSLIPENEKTIAYARQHRDIIARFGRFPHRNKILGRSSTPEEIEFLKEFQEY